MAEFGKFFDNESPQIDNKFSQIGKFLSVESEYKFSQPFEFAKN